MFLFFTRSGRRFCYSCHVPRSFPVLKNKRAKRLTVWRLLCTCVSLFLWLWIRCVRTGKSERKGKKRLWHMICGKCTESKGECVCNESAKNTTIADFLALILFRRREEEKKRKGARRRRRKQNPVWMCVTEGHGIPGSDVSFLTEITENAQQGLPLSIYAWLCVCMCVQLSLYDLTG